MTQVRTRVGLGAVALAALLTCAGCKKQKRSTGGGSERERGGASEVPPLPELPPDATALLGFVATGTPPGAADIRAAAVALTGDDLLGADVDAMFDTCVVPVTAALRRSTIVFLAQLEDERTVALAEGPRLRAALEPCLLKLAAAMTDQPQPARQDGRLTIYPAGDNMLVAAWNGTDRVVLGAEASDVERVLDGRGALKDAALAKTLAAVDTNAPVWFAAGGNAAPPMVTLASMRAHAKGARAEGHMTFGADGVAEEAGNEIAGESRGAIKATVQGRELHLEGELAKVLTTLRPRRKGGADPPPPPLEDKHVRTLLASGPMMLALFLVAVDGDSKTAAAAAPAVAAPPAPAVTPLPPPAPAPPPGP